MIEENFSLLKISLSTISLGSNQFKRKPWYNYYFYIASTKIIKMIPEEELFIVQNAKILF